MFQDSRRCGGQFTYAKAFDKFAPLGPRLVSPKVFEEQVKMIETRVNGKTVQRSPLDFIFPVNELVSFLSQGESTDSLWSLEVSAGLEHGS
jgi:2-keto-4-pentenoate hydratase/2-oxohepta-3-ene-1,7-dioic acid hydratase in catechol pathway